MNIDKSCSQTQNKRPIPTAWAETNEVFPD